MSLFPIPKLGAKYVSPIQKFEGYESSPHFTDQIRLSNSEFWRRPKYARKSGVASVVFETTENCAFQKTQKLRAPALRFSDQEPRRFLMLVSMSGSFY